MEGENVLGPEEMEKAAQEEALSQQTITYRHNTTSRFAVRGRSRIFEFRDHLMSIPAHLEEEFKELYRGLTPVDKQAIVKLKVVNNELPVLDAQASSTATAIRGPVSTPQINAPKVVQPAQQQTQAPAAGLAGLVVKK